jgi:hypothetical protein
LIGKELATVSARPETSVVTAYEWNGFKLLDTPGIDAPTEHERVSREQLSKSDIVLFVLSTDGSFDEEIIYDEIIDIVISGKPIIVIINNKNGYSESDTEYLIIHEKVLSNIHAIGQKNNFNNLPQRIPVSLINAKLALKGMLGENSTLTGASGLNSLTQIIGEILRQSNSHAVAMTLHQSFIKLIDLALAKLNNINTRDDSLRILTEKKAAVVGEKNSVHAKVTRGVNRIAIDFRNSFYAAVEARDESAMQAAMQRAVETTTQVMEREINAVSPFLSKICTSLGGVEPIHVMTEASLGEFGANASQESEEKNGLSLSESLIDGVKNITQQIGKESAEQTTQAAVKAALEITKEWIPSLMKGTGKKTIEKISENAGRFAGKAAPLIGPAIDAVRGIYDYYQAVKQQEEYAQTLKRRAQALADHVNQTTENLEIELLDACRLVLEPLFSSIEKTLSDQSQNLIREAQSFAADRHNLELLKIRLGNLI